MKIGVKIDSFEPRVDLEDNLSYTKVREFAQMAETGELDSIWLLLPIEVVRLFRSEQ